MLAGHVTSSLHLSPWLCAAPPLCLLPCFSLSLPDSALLRAPLPFRVALIFRSTQTRSQIKRRKRQELKSQLWILDVRWRSLCVCLPPPDPTGMFSGSDTACLPYFPEQGRRIPCGAGRAPRASVSSDVPCVLLAREGGTAALLGGTHVCLALNESAPFIWQGT